MYTVYTYAWAHKYASLVGRLTPTLLLRHPSCAHICTRGTCPRVPIYEYGVYWRNMPNPVFTSPAYISPAGDSNHPLCIRISNRRGRRGGGGPLSAFHARTITTTHGFRLCSLIQASFSLRFSRVTFLFFPFFSSNEHHSLRISFLHSRFGRWNDFLSNFSTSYFLLPPRKMWR